MKPDESDVRATTTPKSRGDIRPAPPAPPHGPRPPVTPESSDWLRPLGPTGLTVSAVAAGGGPLGGMPELFGYDTPEQQAVGIVHDILASPIRVIDTANGYSDGKSE